MVNIFDISFRVGTSIFELEIRTNILINPDWTKGWKKGRKS